MSQTYSGVVVYVSIAGVDYTAAQLNLIKMEVIDSDEGDSEIEITCEDNKYAIADNPNIKIGATVSVKWGYANGELSKVRSNYIMMKPAVSYTKDGVETTIKAYTKSATLAAVRARKTHSNTTVAAVVQEIADRAGLTLDITGGSEQMDSFASANWSDRQTLRVLADRYGYQVSFSSGTITFAKVDYGQAPVISLVYGKGETGNIIDAHLNVDARKSMGDTATTASAVDPIQKILKTVLAQDSPKTVAVSAEDGHTWLTQTVAAVSAAVTPGVFEVPKNSLNPPPSVAQFLSSPDVTNLGSFATGEKTRKQKKKGELSIVSIGFPSGTCRKIVHVSGLAKRDSGNWYVHRVTHKINTMGGYDCDWELSRHGNNTKGGEAPPSKVNNAPAPANTAEPTVTVNAETGGTQ